MVLGPFNSYMSSCHRYQMNTFREPMTGKKSTESWAVPDTAYGISIWPSIKWRRESALCSHVRVEEAAVDEPETNKGPGLLNLDFSETD